MKAEGKTENWDTSRERDGKGRGKTLVIDSEMGGRNSYRKDSGKSRN